MTATSAPTMNASESASGEVEGVFLVHKGRLWPIPDRATREAVQVRVRAI